MVHEHNYKLTAEWTGNKGDGTKNVRTYDRSHTVAIQGKPDLLLTTDNPAVGDKSKLNPVFYVADETMVEKAIELHHKAHEICFIANSVNFEVKCNPTCKVE
jgi:organic hydroperoxide reductase OsmC/OhrA